MGRRFTTMILGLLLVPAVAARPHEGRKQTLHRTNIVSTRQVRTGTLPATRTEPNSAHPLVAVPISVLLIILAGLVAVAFAAFMGMPFSGPPRPALAHVKLRF